MSLHENFVSNSMFEYKSEEKIQNAVILSCILISMGLLIFAFYFYPILEFWKDSFLYDITQSVLDSIRNRSPQGIFLIAFLGGLFFLVFPVELYFLHLLSESNHPYTTYFFYIFGILIAQSLNYWLGLRGSRLCKLLIPPAKFYRMKGSLNRWGFWFILFVNALPLPSPVFSAVTGAFRYNYKKFFVYMATGTLILYTTLFAIAALGFSETKGEEIW